MPVFLACPFVQFIPDGNIKTSFKQCSLLFLPTGINAKGQVQRAKTDETCNNKYNGKDQQNNTKGTSYHVCKIKNCKNYSNQQPDHFVNGTHVFLHNFQFLEIYIKRMIKNNNNSDDKAIY
jgi:hypothetical protein